MDKALLESKMALHRDTRKTLAAYLGISERSLISKINESGTEFRQGEIAAIKKRYSLSEEEVVGEYTRVLDVTLGKGIYGTKR